MRSNQERVALDGWSPKGLSGTSTRSGSPGRIRTAGQTINSRLLYR
jgi:hypothetical protein